MSVRAAAVLAVLLAAGCGDGNGSMGPPVPTPTPPGPTPAPRQILVVTHTTGFRHDSIPAAEAALAQMSSSSSSPFQVQFCRTQDDVTRMLTPSGLAPFSAVAFINTTGNLGIPNVAAFLDWVRAGHGFVGVHSASDTYHDEPGYVAMLGGEFLTHGAIAQADVRVRAQHPAVAHLGSGFTIVDELYRFTRFDPSAVTVVLAMDRVPDDGLGNAGSPADLPLAWHRTAGTGRVFYTALGHRSELWTDPRFTQHIFEALRWAVFQ